MTKAELIENIVKLGISKKLAGAAINEITDSITKSLKKGESVSLVGFGTFKVVKRAARKGINPATKAEIKIPAKKVAKFVPGKALKEAVKK